MNSQSIDLEVEYSSADRVTPITEDYYLRTPDPSASLRRPAISVIVAFSDHTPLDEMVNALADQTAGASAEYILVDAQHVLDEQTVRHKIEQAAAVGHDITYHRINRHGRAAANNYGILHAKADLLLFLADDFVPMPGLVAEHLGFHDRQPERHIVGIGPGIFPPQEKLREFMRWLDDSGELMGVSFTRKDAVIPAEYFCAANTSAKKSLLFAAGLFDEDFSYDAWDDYEMGLRLSRIGMKAVYLPTAVAHHLHDVPVHERRRAMRNAGESAALFEQKYPEPQAWREKCRLAPWRLELAAQWFLLKSLVRRDPRARERYWHLTLERSFVAAYRQHAADPLKIEAKALLLAGQAAQAKGLYEQLCAQGKGDAETWVNLGKLHGLEKAWDRAEQCCREAIALDPVHAEAHGFLGTVLEARGHSDGAIASYRRALELKPSFAEIHFTLGNILLARRQPSSAVHHYEQAIRFNPQQVAAYTLLGRALVETGKTIEAARVLYQGLQIAPSDPGIRDDLNGLLSTLDEYTDWIFRYDTLSDEDRLAIKKHILALPGRPLMSLIVPLCGVSAGALHAAIDSVLGQLYPHWELLLAGDAAALAQARAVLGRFPDPRIRLLAVDQGGQDTLACNAALAQAAGDYAALLDPDGELAEHALYAVACELHRHPSAELLYSDEDRLNEQGRRADPDFKPDWNPDLLLSRNYLARLCVYRTARWRALGGLRPEAADGAEWDLALRAAEQLLPGDIRHIPRVLYHARTPPPQADAIATLRAHFARRGIAAEPFLNIHGWPQVKYPIPAPAPRVSLIIPTRNGYDILSRCIASILAKTVYPEYEIVIVDNQSDDPQTLDYLAELGRRGIKVLRYDAPFNYSAINNFAVRDSEGDIIGLINNDVEVITPGWLDEMVSQALRPEIGAVGSMLYYPDDSIQHAGVVLYLGIGHAGHRLRGRPRGFRGPRDVALQVQNLSAVTGACLLLRRAVFEQVGGMDEALEVAFNDVDLCLRIRAQGYRILWTPHAELSHHEFRTRGPDDTAEKKRRSERELNYVKRRWGGDSALTVEPGYNPNLALSEGSYALAFPPRLAKSWKLWRALPMDLLGQKDSQDDRSAVMPFVPVRRNALCFCGSGERYKHCHGRLAQDSLRA